MHMHGLSSHILYKANAHTMMSSQNLSVPDFMSSGKTPGVHPSRKEFSHADKPGMAHGTRLIATYILSGILLAILSFALFKFRLPENQVNLAVCAVYILSCFFGGMIDRKNNEDQAFFLGPGPRNSLFSVFISHVPRPEGRCHGRHQKTSLCPRHVHIERNGGRMVS